MNLIKVAIIDDEPAAIEVIKALAMLTEDLQVEAIATNGQDAIQTIIQHKPDLVFLDVNMPLINGLEVVEKLPVRNFEVIFTTGSEDHALQAIKLEAVDYLLKPIDPADFFIAVEKVRAKLKSKYTVKQEAVPYKIQLTTLQGIIYIEENKIIHIISQGSYSHIITESEKITVSKNIGQIEEKLSGNFYRCHNSHIINLDFVNSFMNKNGTFVVMKNGAQVEVSRRSKDELLKKMRELAK